MLDDHFSWGVARCRSVQKANILGIFFINDPSFLIHCGVQVLRSSWGVFILMQMTFTLFRRSLFTLILNRFFDMCVTFIGINSHQIWYTQNWILLVLSHRLAHLCCYYYFCFTSCTERRAHTVPHGIIEGMVCIWIHLQNPQLKISTCLPVTLCHLVFDDRWNVADTVTWSQYWSGVGIFCNMTIVKLVQS